MESLDTFWQDEASNKMSKEYAEKNYMISFSDLEFDILQVFKSCRINSSIVKKIEHYFLWKIFHHQISDWEIILHCKNLILPSWNANEIEK